VVKHLQEMRVAWMRLNLYCSAFWLTNAIKQKICIYYSSMPYKFFPLYTPSHFYVCGIFHLTNAHFHPISVLRDTGVKITQRNQTYFTP